MLLHFQSSHRERERGREGGREREREREGGRDVESEREGEMGVEECGIADELELKVKQIHALGKTRKYEDFELIMLMTLHWQADPRC